MISKQTPDIVEGSFIPSPYGVLVFKTITNRGTGDKLIMFPSPCGVLVFKTLMQLERHVYGLGFRPLTGC